MLLSLTKRVRLIAQSTASVCLAIVVLLATLTFTQVSTGASASLMSCCNGMAGHCDSGMMSKEAPPLEPMCGLDTEGDIAEITIVAEPLETSTKFSSDDSSHAAFTVPCPTECCSLVWAGYRKPNRDFAYLIQRRVVAHNGSEERSHALSQPLFTSTHFNKSIPRGPPSFAV
jgi:hypothetical protein